MHSALSRCEPLRLLFTGIASWTRTGQPSSIRAFRGWRRVQFSQNLRCARREPGLPRGVVACEPVSVRQGPAAAPQVTAS